MDITLGGGELDVAAIAGAIGLELGVVDELIIDGLQGNGAAGAVIAIGMDHRSSADVGGIGNGSDGAAGIAIGLH